MQISKVADHHLRHGHSLLVVEVNHVGSLGLAPTEVSIVHQSASRSDGLTRPATLDPPSPELSLCTTTENICTQNRCSIGGWCVILLDWLKIIILLLHSWFCCSPSCVALPVNMKLCTSKSITFSAPGYPIIKGRAQGAHQLPLPLLCIVHHDLVPGGALLAVALPIFVKKSVDPFKDTRGVVVLHYVLAFSLVTCWTLMSAIYDLPLV